MEIANKYFLKNISNNGALRKLYDLQVKQDTAFASHFINPFKGIEKILLETKIEFSQFVFYNSNGGFETLNLIKGRKYLIDFWFVSCAPCVRDHKLISAKLDLLKNNNIEIISISTDKDQEEWRNYLTTHKYNWLNVREIDDREKTARDNLLIGVFPTYILIDENGNVVDRSFAFTEVLDHLHLE